MWKCLNTDGNNFKEHLYQLITRFGRKVNNTKKKLERSLKH